MIQNVLNKYFFYLYVFTLFFGVLFYNTTGFKALDIVSSLLLVVIYIIYLVGTKDKNFHIGFFVVLFIFLFYLNYSLYISNNTQNAIALDFLSQIRPYFTFFIVSQMSPSFTVQQKTILKKICFYVWLLFVPIGLLATINPSFLSTMMDQPSNYIACITCLSVVYLYCSNFSVKDKLTFILMLAIGLITHSEFYIFFLVICGLIMYFHHGDVLRSNLKTGIALTVISGLIIYFSRAEIFNYIFPAGVAGDGFASFASQASSFYSQINDTGFNPINGIANQEWFAGPTSYYPVLAQLGIIGILLYIVFWAYVIASAIILFKRKGNIQPFIIVIILAVYIFLENISDSFFTSNKGYFVMMFIGLLLGKPDDPEYMMLNTTKTNHKKKKYGTHPIIRLPGYQFFSWNKRVQPANELPYLTPVRITVSKPEEPVAEIIEAAPVVTTNQPQTVEAVEAVEAVQTFESAVSFAAEDEYDDAWDDDFEDDYLWEDDFEDEEESEIEEEVVDAIDSVDEVDEIEAIAKVEEVEEKAEVDEVEVIAEMDEIEAIVEVDEVDETEAIDETDEEDETNEINIELSAGIIEDEIKFVASPQEVVEEEIKFVAPPQEVVKEEIKFVAPPQEVVKEEIKFIAPPQEVVKEEKTLIFNIPIQFTEASTQPPAMNYIFSKSYESKQQTVEQSAENEAEDLMDGAYNYMI